MIAHIFDRVPQSRVGFNLAFGKLAVKPFLQTVHQLKAMLAMKRQPVVGIQALFARLGVKTINLAQCFQHKPALLGKVTGNFDKLPSPMRLIWAST